MGARVTPTADIRAWYEFGIGHLLCVGCNVKRILAPNQRLGGFSKYQQHPYPIREAFKREHAACAVVRVKRVRSKK